MQAFSSLARQRQGFDLNIGLVGCLRLTLLSEPRRLAFHALWKKKVAAGDPKPSCQVLPGIQHMFCEEGAPRRKDWYGGHMMHDWGAQLDHLRINFIMGGVRKQQPGLACFLDI